LKQRGGVGFCGVLAEKESRGRDGPVICAVSVSTSLTSRSGGVSVVRAVRCACSAGSTGGTSVDMAASLYSSGA
jgi:hypothetical protein